ncbi:MAG: RagB/SusD family nutrient uptake outer membrane protein [Prevotellaceae bacterium]|jgi:hypothetical protein|nr:RagB/SusD family nutrient uptake outer membrane protein [Prevotellaceae bacterium]
MKIKHFIYLIPALLFTTGCDLLDTRIDTQIMEKNLETNFQYLFDMGYSPYANLNSGFYHIDNNIAAPMSDEAEQTAASSNSQIFNNGSWGPYNNPDDTYGRCYAGIRAAHIFLDYSVDYTTKLALNRDTVSDGGYQYRRDVADIAFLRAEAQTLIAYYYFELIKRYGAVPYVDKALSLDDETDLPRIAYHEIVDKIVAKIDEAADYLQVNWKNYDSQRDGRFTKGAALALKSRILLYAASKRDNPDNDKEKWKRAALAAYDVIQLNQYSLASNYRTLFLESNSVTEAEIIMSIRGGSSNEIEKANYPIGTPGGNSGVTPSQNLVSAYEYKSAPDPNNPYANRDPRLEYSVVTNNSQWNGRTIRMWQGDDAEDAWDKTNASKTGYYLKKFLIENLYLIQDEKRIHNWTLFRYAEILLNYAEAMNEAYGPDNDNGYGLTARQAVNQIRSRQGVAMPPVEAANDTEMRERIKHERRIELAFEGHRFFDLLRWKDAEYALNQPLKGVRVAKQGENFTYTEFTVENRIFSAPKMYYYPIPQTEINKSKNVLHQNEGW